MQTRNTADWTLINSFFALYSATISYAAIYHSHDIKLGFRSLINSFKKQKDSTVDFEDVHNRLMKKYPEVSELWYLALNVVSVGFGVAAVAGWPTYVSPRMPSKISGDKISKRGMN